jgi:hypothetical protein
MPVCVRCGEWFGTSGAPGNCLICDGRLCTGSEATAITERQAASHGDLIRRRAAAAAQSGDPDPATPAGDGVVVILGVAAVIAATAIASVVAAVLTRDVVVVVAAAAGGALFGLAWLFGVGGISDRPIRWRLRKLALSVSLYGAPVVSVVVAIVAVAGYAWAVVVVLVPTLIASWASMRGEGSTSWPQTLDGRLAWLARRRDAGYLTAEEYEAIAADLRTRAATPSGG